MDSLEILLIFALAIAIVSAWFYRIRSRNLDELAGNLQRQVTQANSIIQSSAELSKKKPLSHKNWQISDRGHWTGCSDGHFRLSSYYDSKSVEVKSVHDIPKPTYEELKQEAEDTPS